MRRRQDAFEKAGIAKKEKAQRLSSALSQVEADNRDMTARYQQLELRPSPPASTNALPPFVLQSAMCDLTRPFI
jgi:hypothetical protein